MTTAKTTNDEALGESWVDLSLSNGSMNNELGDSSAAGTASASVSNNPTSPDRITPLPFGNGEEYLKLLREAQKDSNHSSSIVSLASSRKETPRSSPKSPPNSPNTELSSETEYLKGMYINDDNGKGASESSSDWVWDWSSRPEQQPPKGWAFRHPKKKTYNLRHAKVGKNGLFSKEVLYSLVITNLLSVILGTGIGLWLSKRNMWLSRVALD